MGLAPTRPSGSEIRPPQAAGAGINFDMAPISSGPHHSLLARLLDPPSKRPCREPDEHLSHLPAASQDCLPGTRMSPAPPSDRIPRTKLAHSPAPSPSLMCLAAVASARTPSPYRGPPGCVDESQRHPTTFASGTSSSANTLPPFHSLPLPPSTHGCMPPPSHHAAEPRALPHPMVREDGATPREGREPQTWQLRPAVPLTAEPKTENQVTLEGQAGEQRHGPPAGLGTLAPEPKSRSNLQVSGTKRRWVDAFGVEHGRNFAMEGAPSLGSGSGTRLGAGLQSGSSAADAQRERKLAALQPLPLRPLALQRFRGGMGGTGCWVESRTGEPDNGLRLSRLEFQFKEIDQQLFDMRYRFRLVEIEVERMCALSQRFGESMSTTGGQRQP